MSTDWRNDPATPANLKEFEEGHAFEPRYTSGRAAFAVKTSEWEHVARATFGPARAVSPRGVGWTGRSHRYDIYRYTGESAFDEGAWALRFSHGGGDGWLTHKTLDGETNILEIISKLSEETLRWDAAHFLAESIDKTASEAASAERARIFKAHADGKLKKTKIRGKDAVRVEVVA